MRWSSFQDYATFEQKALMNLGIIRDSLYRSGNTLDLRKLFASSTCLKFLRWLFKSLDFYLLIFLHHPFSLPWGSSLVGYHKSAPWPIKSSYPTHHLLPDLYIGPPPHHNLQPTTETKSTQHRPMQLSHSGFSNQPTLPTHPLPPKGLWSFVEVVSMTT